MGLGRHERVLAVQADYVSIKAPESGRTAAYHASQVVECKQSRRVVNSFKLTVVMGNREMKRFDFEAKNPKDASEIISSVRGASSPLAYLPGSPLTVLRIGVMSAFKAARDAKRT
jgi:hypothetical protein